MSSDPLKASKGRKSAAQTCEIPVTALNLCDEAVSSTVLCGRGGRAGARLVLRAVYAMNAGDTRVEQATGIGTELQGEKYALAPETMDVCELKV